MREELELHRTAAECAGCHKRIDPFGFVLEHYAQFGAWRDKDRGKPVSARTTLVDGVEVNGLTEFKQYLLKRRKKDFIRNITERMFEFALGRQIQYSDEATIQKILHAVADDDFRARTLIKEIVRSDAFLTQSNTPESP